MATNVFKLCNCIVQDERSHGAALYLVNGKLRMNGCVVSGGTRAGIVGCASEVLAFNTNVYFLHSIFLPLILFCRFATMLAMDCSLLGDRSYSKIVAFSETINTH